MRSKDFFFNLPKIWLPIVVRFTRLGHTIKWQSLVTFWFNWINNMLISSKITCINVENKWLRFYRHLLGVGSCHPITDYGRPIKPFFIKVPNFWAWADNLGRQVLGHLRYFRLIYQRPFWYCESLVHVFHQSTIISTKN